MTCEVTASREALTTSRACEGLWRTRVGRGAATIVLSLRIWQLLLLLLSIRVLRRRRNVVVVVEHGHRGLHRGRRRVSHAIQMLGRHRGV